MATLTKRELVQEIADQTGVVQAKVFTVIQQTLDLITDALARGDTVELRNFGVLEVRLTQPRVGRNPHQPENPVHIPARAAVKFKPGKIMRQRVSRLVTELKERKQAAPENTRV